MSHLLLASAEIFQPPVAQKVIPLCVTAMSLFRAVLSNALLHENAVDLHIVGTIL